MNTRASVCCLLLLGIVVAFGGTGCSKDPLKELKIKRMQYKIELTNWTWKGEERSGEVVLDFSVQNENSDRLDYVTVLVEEMDLEKNIVNERLVPLDVSQIPPGQSGAVTAYIENVSEHVDEGFIGAKREANPPRSAWQGMPEFRAFVNQ
ncbi:hypothetical protein ACFLU6_00300 [Acidobacteriota bacterium]